MRGFLLAAWALVASGGSATAGRLPTPENLRVVAFTTNSLSLAVDEVAGAAGYRFAVDRLEGFPRTERRVDFASAPQLSSGWSFGDTNGVVLGKYTGTGYYDSRTAADKAGLKIEVKAASGARAEILSPLAPDRLIEYSFFARAASASGDTVSVYGRETEDGTWLPLADPLDLTTTMTWTTNVLSESVNVRQVKFVFEAASKVNGALDSLRIVYGGKESRIPVPTGDAPTDDPACALSNLTANARYAFRAQAVADPTGASSSDDSPWTDEQTIDLSWASMTVTPPTDVEWEMDGATMMVRWSPVAGADHYLVDVVPSNDPAHPLVSGAKTSVASFEVTVPSLGEYAVTVRAVSPGGVSTAASEPLVGEVELEALSSVTLKAVDRRTVEASWAEVPLAEGYQVKLLTVNGSAETTVFDWPVDDEGRCVLPDGWTCDAWWADPSTANTWTNNRIACPALPYGGSFLATDDLEQPVTEVTCVYKCGSSAKSVLENTRLVLSAKTGGGESWREVTNLTVAAALATVRLVFAPEEDMRGLRLEAREQSPAGAKANVRIGKLTIVAGAETRTEVGSVLTTGTKAVFPDLDANGRYAVTVVPRPSEGETLGATSATVDLSSAYFRKTGAVPVSKVREGAYVENFDSLSNVSAKVETRSLPLDYWQFVKDGDRTESILYSASTNFTAGGIYVFSDEDRSVASFMLGTLATGTYGCSFGIAFRNDTEDAVGVGTLSFDSVQRTFKNVTQSYVPEGLLADGETDIDADGDWQPLTIAPTAPYVAGDPQACGEYRQTIEITEGLPAKIPAGWTLILRWRHEKGSSGPAMGIDNVRLEINRRSRGFNVIIR